MNEIKNKIKELIENTDGKLILKLNVFDKTKKSIFHEDIERIYINKKNILSFVVEHFSGISYYNLNLKNINKWSLKGKNLSIQIKEDAFLECNKAFSTD